VLVRAFAVIGWGSIIGWGSNSHFHMLIISQCCHQ